MPTSLPARAGTAPTVASTSHPALWRIMAGLLLIKLSRYAFALAERLCTAAERVARLR